ncbi:MAG: 16S rRNA (cytidine(1402)-2'-O)-methyltransferase [Candidatus Gastranaerophilales bacterium]|nr:16S rRNA (cytidine(1402)-2'-O)-methyltransferase [Candidatus Gastranaerophilales bacterium]
MPYQFYIAATPIGNLKDITLRTVEVLQTVDYIACEDTRVTRILSQKYNLSAKLFDCHKFNEKERSKKIIDLIKTGNTVAFVSDAGTPGISDPGGVLLEELYKNNIKLTALPGACTVADFLSLVPRNNEEFAFIGFMPRIKNQQYQILKKHKYTNCVFFESPNRLLDTLDNIKEFFGTETKIAIARELTKVFEEIKILNIEEMIDYYSKSLVKGEIVGMIFASTNSDYEQDELLNKIALLQKEGFSHKDIVVIISKLFGENKNKIYKMLIH